MPPAFLPQTHPSLQFSALAFFQNFCLPVHFFFPFAACCCCDVRHWAIAVHLSRAHMSCTGIARNPQGAGLSRCKSGNSHTPHASLLRTLCQRVNSCATRATAKAHIGHARMDNGSSARSTLASLSSDQSARWAIDWRLRYTCAAAPAVFKCNTHTQLCHPTHTPRGRSTRGPGGQSVPVCALPDWKEEAAKRFQHPSPLL